MKEGEDVGKLRLPKEGGVLGEVEQMLGNRRMIVRCADGKTRLCRIPGKIRKRLWLREGDLVLVQPWEVQQEERGDILACYSPAEVEWLRKKGYLSGLKA